jgi:hypothetical protein
MSTRHIKELAANVKSGRASSGWLADMAILELGDIEDALRIVMTDASARAPTEEYRKAKVLLERVARGS